MTGFQYRWFCATVAAVVAMAPLAISAHPHVWVTAAANLKFDADKLTRIGMRWQFDSFFSQVLTGDFDKNADGVFDVDETQAMFDQVFTSLKDFGFFTHIRVGGADAVFDHAENFSTATDRGDLVYTFDLVLSEPVDPTAAKVQFTVYDPTIYVDIAFGGDLPVTVDPSSGAKCTWALSNGDELSNEGAYITPQVVTLECGKWPAYRSP